MHFTHRQRCTHNRGHTATESLAQGLWRRRQTFVSEHFLGPGSFLVYRLCQLSQLLQSAVASGSLRCMPCFPPHITSYPDITLKRVQSILLSKLGASVGLVMKPSYVKGRKKPASSGSPKCFPTCSKYSELFSYCGCSCASQPKSNTDITCSKVCNPQMPRQVCILWEAVVKMLPSSTKAVVHLLAKVKGHDCMVIYSIYTTETSSQSQGSCFSRIWIWIYSEI